MHYSSLAVAASLAALLGGGAVVTAPSASATPMAVAPAAERPAVDGPPSVTTTWEYTMEADWVRMHTRPTARSTTKALARLYDYSGLMSQRAPQSNGFILFTDRKIGVTGWVLTSYVHEQICFNGQCQ